MTCDRNTTTLTILPSRGFVDIDAALPAFFSLFLYWREAHAIQDGNSRSSVPEIEQRPIGRID